MESGTKLGHYTISSLIGKGGMGEVYQAKDEKLGRQVAGTFMESFIICFEWGGTDRKRIVCRVLEVSFEARSSRCNPARSSTPSATTDRVD